MFFEAKLALHVRHLGCFRHQFITSPREAARLSLLGFPLLSNITENYKSVDKMSAKEEYVMPPTALENSSQ